MDLAEIVGANCRAIRGEASMAELAECARRYGVRWNSGEVAKIEQGLRRPTVAMLVVLSGALGVLTEGRVTVSDLIEFGNTPIELSESLQIANGSVLREILGGNATLDESPETVLDRSMRRSPPMSLLPLPPGISVIEAVDARWSLTEAEERIARSMDVDVMSFAAWSVHKWGRPFISERDARAGAAANAQQRGRITRVMKDELREAISRGNH